MLKNPKARRLLFALLIPLLIFLLIYLITHGQHYFDRQSLREILRLIRSFGALSPLVVVFLIFLSTLVPPLPLPVPLIELSSGLIFGFLGGFLLVWASQVFSSIAAFYISRFFGKKLFSSVTNNKIWSPYQQYLKKRGPTAVFILRSAMAAPFNIVSFGAGLTDMKFYSFALATILGTILETALFTYIGSIIRVTRINLWYLFILVVILGGLGAVVAFLMMRFITPDEDDS